MNFGDALVIIKRGGYVTRTGWNGKRMHIFLEPGGGKLLPYIVMKTVQGNYVPWLASQTDVLADDWEEASDV